MPGGDPLHWSMVELNHAIEVKSKEKEYIANLAQYIVYWIVNTNTNRKELIDMEDMDPYSFIAYKKYMQNQPKETTTSVDEAERKQKSIEADRKLYQRYHQRKAAAVKKQK